MGLNPSAVTSLTAELVRTSTLSLASAFCPHDPDRDFLVRAGVGVRMRSQVMIEQLAMKALRLFGSVEKQTVLLRTLCTEIVGFAAYRDDRVLERQASLRDDNF